MIKKNSVVFDGNSFKKKIEQIILDGFSNDPNKANKFWFKAFGNHKLKCYKSFIIENPSFPCFVINVTSVPARRYAHSTQVNQFSSVLLEIHFYVTDVNEIEKEHLGGEIIYRTTQILQEKLGLIITSDTEIVSADTRVYRRLLRSVFIYDNVNKIIYKGE